MKDDSNPSKRIIGFVDNTTLLASGKTLNDTHELLKSMMECRNGVFDWSRSYNSPLEMNKLALVDFMHSFKKASNAKVLTLMQTIGPDTFTHQVRPSPNAKLLGVIFNEKLNWSAQHEHVRKKAVKWTTAFKRFTKAASGIWMQDAQKLYKAVALPKICYASDLWFHTNRQRPARTAIGQTSDSSPKAVTK